MQNFHVYKSSAGSGKTYTLVREYLKIVLYNPGAVRHILAITFTNAAAAEMKERIIEGLGLVAALGDPGKASHPGNAPDPARTADPASADKTANDPDKASHPGNSKDPARAGNAANSPDKAADTARETARKKGRALLEQIMSDREAEGEAPLQEWQLIHNAQLVLKKILHQYSDFSVSTIDSFVHRVIRTFAFDLRIPLHFEVSLDADTLLKQAVELLINQAGREKKLTDLLVSYIISQADDEKDVRIEQQITRLAKTLTDEESSKFIEQLKEVEMQDFQQLAGKLKGKVKAFEDEVSRLAGDALELIHRNGIPPEAFYRGKSGIYNYFLHLSRGHIRDKIKPNSYVKKTIEEDKWVSGKCTSTQEDSIQAIRNELVRSFACIRSLAEKNLETYLNRKAVLRSIFPLAVLNEVEKMLEDIKNEHIILHISDFNKRIASIITEQPVPFIYERLGERYRHYMIDEFQDTSMLQWQNLLPLVENSLSAGHLSLIVGDGKQAIYRFRNGDVEQFANLPALTGALRKIAQPEWEVTLKNNYRKISLDTNWRSAQEIINFNNEFFRFARQQLPEEMQGIYKEVTQKARPDKEVGYVDIRFLEGRNKEELNENTLQIIPDIIKKCKDAGHSLQDITILCRANEEARMVAKMLLTENIPVISPDSLLLSYSPEVNFFLSVITLLDNPSNPVAAAEMITFLHQRGQITSPPDLHKSLEEAGLTGQKAKSGSSLLPGLEKLMHANGIDFSFRVFEHQNIYDTCETILRHFFTADAAPNPFVAYFTDAVYDFSEKHMLSYADFLEWWEENQQNYSIVIPEGTEAIRVMTVHKSKGLQFPVVIHPFAVQKPDKPTRKGFWTTGESANVPELPAAWLEMSKSTLAGTPFEKDYNQEQEKTFLDMLNATYVAFTRPSEKLFILSGKEANNYKPRTINGMLHNFLVSKGLWDDSEIGYRFGSFDSSTTKTAPDRPETDYFRHLMSEQWTRALRIRSHQKERSSLLDGTDPLERGNLLHRAMEMIDSHNDVGEVLRQMVANGEIDHNKQTEWGKKIGHILSDPVVAPCFAPGVKARKEAGLFDENGTFYRPDRVVFMDNETIILDYKTGKAYQKHREQMEGYAGILRSMGYPEVKKLLIYLDKGVAETV